MTKLTDRFALVPLKMSLEMANAKVEQALARGRSDLFLDYEVALSARPTQELEAAVERGLKALEVLTAWSGPFIEQSPISAETLWREFPKAIHEARDAIKSLNHLLSQSDGERTNVG